VLYLPDEILVVDHMRQSAAVHRYEFEVAGASTAGLPRATAADPYRLDRAAAARPSESDHSPGEYAALVERARAAFARGDLFEGVLAEPFDALDGFLSHAWEVTVTGAPNLWAIRFIEEQERSARRWYGGAIGRVTFDGNMNTGLTLRTMRMKEGVAEVRAGATLLFDSDPQAEEAETRLKASALFTAIRGTKTTSATRTEAGA